jgi:hypothetical protein
MDTVRNTISRVCQHRVTCPLLMLVALVSLGCDKAQVPAAQSVGENEDYLASPECS